MMQINLECQPGGRNGVCQSFFIGRKNLSNGNNKRAGSPRWILTGKQLPKTVRQPINLATATNTFCCPNHLRVFRENSKNKIVAHMKADEIERLTNELLGRRDKNGKMQTHFGRKDTPEVKSLRKFLQTLSATGPEHAFYLWPVHNTRI